MGNLWLSSRWKRFISGSLLEIYALSGSFQVQIQAGLNQVIEVKIFWNSEISKIFHSHSHPPLITNCLTMSILVTRDFINMITPKFSIWILAFGKIKGIEGGQNSLMSISFKEVDFYSKSQFSPLELLRIEVLQLPSILYDITEVKIYHCRGNPELICLLYFYLPLSTWNELWRDSTWLEAI